jgi:hypothetical protein
MNSLLINQKEDYSDLCPFIDLKSWIFFSKEDYVCLEFVQCKLTKFSNTQGKNYTGIGHGFFFAHSSSNSMQKYSGRSCYPNKSVFEN